MFSSRAGVEEQRFSWPAAAPCKMHSNRARTEPSYPFGKQQRHMSSIAGAEQSKAMSQRHARLHDHLFAVPCLSLYDVYH